MSLWSASIKLPLKFGRQLLNAGHMVSMLHRILVPQKRMGQDQAEVKAVQDGHHVAVVVYTTICVGT